MSTVAYISLELDEKSKSALKDFVKKNIDKKYFCHLKFKGGDVTYKAHLTLLFGFDLDSTDKKDIENTRQYLKQKIKTLNGKRLELFKLNKCNVVVLRVDDKCLSKEHSKLKKLFPVMKKYDRNSFKAHISLCYVSKDFVLSDEIGKRLRFDLRIEDVKFKVFGPRKTHKTSAG